jgi:hypothetical protein
MPRLLSDTDVAEFRERLIAAAERLFGELHVDRFLLEYDSERVGSFEPLRHLPKGKVVVMEWMNPGCPVCKGKMEDGSVAKMMSDSKAINSDVVFLFVNSTASTASKPAESGEYLTKNKISGPALIDGDGAVGAADLSLLLAAWGACS